MLKKSINGTNELRVTKQIAQLFHIHLIQATSYISTADQIFMQSCNLQGAGLQLLDNQITNQGRHTVFLHAQGSASPTYPGAHPSVLIKKQPTIPFKTKHAINRRKKEISRRFHSSKSSLPWGLKLNNGGRKRPFGSRVLGSRSSSKKGWIKASNCIKLKVLLEQIWSIDKKTRVVAVKNEN